MLCVDWSCDKCKNMIGLIDGWNPACKAFPDGIPGKMLKVDVTAIDECANGFKWEPKDDG